MSGQLLYKVLDDGLKSPYKGFVFEQGKEYVCEDFDDDPEIDCSRGFYATGIDGLPYAYNTSRTVWSCEVSGRSVEIDEFKRRYEKICIIEQVPGEKLKELALDIEGKVGYRLSEVLFPVNPLTVTTKEVDYIDLLTKWASAADSVWDSVWASVWESVGESVWVSVGESVWASVWASVWESVGVSVWASVWESVGASVWAYTGSLFDLEDYPFKPAADLWRAGIVPSYDGDKWRLHAGKNAGVMWEGRIE
jgi:hypothetical protein